MNRLKHLGISLALILVLIAIFQNTDEVAVRFLLAKATVPLVVVLLATFLLGALAGFLAATLRRRGRDHAKAAEEPAPDRPPATDSR